jgi:cytochrome P450/ferredoxin
MSPAPVPLSEVDLANLDTFVRNEAWGQFDTLRREAPVFWNPEPPPNSGFWAVTRHADIVAIDKDTETFTSEKYVNLEELDDEYMDLRRSMLETDGARHQALRRLLQRDFGAGPLRRYEDFLGGLARVTVDTALQHREFDFVTEIAADFPIQVLARLLGVPGEFTGQLIDWGNQIIGNTDPDYADVLLGTAESDRYKHLPFRSPASIEIFEYGRKLAAERRGRAGQDLVSKLINRIPEDGQPLSATDYDNYFLLLVVAGNETTRQAISHSMVALMDNPEQLAYLRDNPERLHIGVEELLRWASPVYHFRRTATRDAELRGQKIKAGDKVVMWFASGNRDEEVFPDPYALDVTRHPNEHITFGNGGPHACLGSQLARMEVRIMFETLLPRLESIELAGEVRRVRSNFVNGIKELPVRVRPVSRRGGPAAGRRVQLAAARRSGSRTLVREHEADLVVEEAQRAAEDVAAITLADPDGGDLPDWTPGAHIDLVLTPKLTRQYSLCGDVADPRRWRIGVLRTPDSRGGSALIHDTIASGSTVRVRGPRNHFPLVRSPRYLFISGGIGITPLLPMIREADATGADWRLVYGGRSQASMAFTGELATYGDRVQLIPQDTHGFPDLDALLGIPRPDTAVYCCGPEGLLTAVEQRCAAWPPGSLHVERFKARPQPEAAAGEDTEFEVMLQRSGLAVTVPPGKSIIEAVEEQGVSVLYSCLEGICGTCETGVIDGDVDHRDSILTEEERRAGEFMMICVSRCRSPRLTLDL